MRWSLCNMFIQSARHVVLVVHEPTEDAQVYHLEELQMAHSETVPPRITDMFHWSSHLHVAGSPDR